MTVGIIASKEFFAIQKILGPEDSCRPLLKNLTMLKRRHSGNDNTNHFDILYWKKKPKIRNFDIYAIHCDIGEIAAAAATQALIDHARIDLIVNFGMANALRPGIKRSLHIVNSVVHYDFDVRQCNGMAERGEYPQFSSRYIRPTQEIIDIFANFECPIPLASCASGDTFAVNSIFKANLYRKLNTDICDMNSAGVLLTCITNGLPCMILKGVTDGINNGADWLDETFNNNTIATFEQVPPILDYIAQLY